MKFHSILFAVLVFLGGCGEPNLDDAETIDKILAEAIDEKKLQQRGEEGERLFYAPNEQSPYTGWVKDMHNNGQVESLGNYKDGKQDGLSTRWYENGQKSSETTFKGGLLDGLSTRWYENGQKSWQTIYKNGVPNGLRTRWYKSGQKNFEIISKEGGPFFAAAWKLNGEKCPITNIVNGDGVIMHYNEDGNEIMLESFQNGEKIISGEWIRVSDRKPNRATIIIDGYGAFNVDNSFFTLDKDEQNEVVAGIIEAQGQRIPIWDFEWMGF